MPLIDQIRTALARRGEGPTWLAAQIGEAQPKVSHWLTGRHEPPLAQLCAMARAVGLRSLKIPTE